MPIKILFLPFIITGTKFYDTKITAKCQILSPNFSSNNNNDDVNNDKIK